MQATSCENQQQESAMAKLSNEMLITNYHFRGALYKVKINIKDRAYICNSKNSENHIIKNPVQCQKGHLFCYKCSVVAPQDNGEDKKACPCCAFTSQSKGIDNLSEECFNLQKDFCIARTINNIQISCPIKETFGLNEDSQCYWQGTLKQLKTHLIKDCKILPQAEVIQNRLSELEQQITNVSTNISTLEDLTTKITSQQQKIVQLEQQSSQYQQDITELKQQISEITSITNINNRNYGELIWKIDNYNEKLLEAKVGIQTAIYSPSFYSKQYGHHLKIKMYLDGDSFGKGSHISVYIMVCKGEFDNIIKWPLNAVFHFTVINQEVAGDDFFESIITEPASNSSQKPVSSRNIPTGYPLFLPQKDLKKFIKDDVIFLKINVILNI
jgi:hypothetical protein